MKICSKKFTRLIHRETPVLESLFNKVGGLKPCNFIKRDTDTGVFLKFLRTLY